MDELKLVRRNINFARLNETEIRFNKGIKEGKTVFVKVAAGNCGIT